MTWKLLDKKAEIIPGRSYRSTWYLKAPYTKKLAELIVNTVWAAKDVSRLAGITVEKVLAISPNATKQTPGSRYKRWRVEVFWHRGS